MKTVNKEVTVVTCDDVNWSVKKETREFVIYHEEREKFLCQICQWEHYPECTAECTAYNSSRK